jgi:hypothetical protein
MLVARFCLGMMSLGAAICLGFGAYACWLNRGIARALGGSGQKVMVLGVTLPYPMAMTLLAVLCLIFAFAAVYALFFPKQSSN